MEGKHQLVLLVVIVLFVLYYNIGGVENYDNHGHPNYYHYRGPAYLPWGMESNYRQYLPNQYSGYEVGGLL